MKHNILHLILRYESTGKVWKTPNHSEGKEDDFHREVKEIILQEIDGKLKRKLGNNCDIIIRDDRLVIRSTRFSKKTGKREQKEAYTELKPEYYLDEVLQIITLPLIENAVIDSIRIKKLKTEPIIRVYVYLIRKAPNKS